MQKIYYTRAHHHGLRRMYTPPVDHDIPLADYPPTFADLRDRVEAAFASLAALGCDVEVSDADIEVAHNALQGGKVPSDVLLSSPGTIVHIKALLSAYDQAVVESAAQIRTFVTNKLLLETESPDPRIRIKALELLGKISDVGLFTEKTEITMRHRPTEELEQLLRERLMRTLTPEEVRPPAYTDAAAPRSLEVDEVFGDAESS
jgi:hypothetical protein